MIPAKECRKRSDFEVRLRKFTGVKFSRECAATLACACLAPNSQVRKFHPLLTVR